MYLDTQALPRVDRVANETILAQALTTALVGRPSDNGRSKCGTDQRHTERRDYSNGNEH